MKKLLITFLAVCSFLPMVGFAGTGDNVSGWGYASNLGTDGWISFNCTNHGCWEPYVPGDGGEIEGPGGGDAGTRTDKTDNNTNTNRTFLYDKNSLPKLGLFSEIGNVFKDILRPVIGRTALADFHTDAFFDGSNYGVSVDPISGLMSGYAWNNKVGWISFNESVGCPEGDCSPTLDLGTGRLEGWARVVEHSGGWDGWISLSCTNASAYTFGCLSNSYRPIWNPATELVEEGRPYAWGGDVLGWVHLAEPGFEMKIELDQPIVTLTATDLLFCPEDSVTLNWNAVGMTSCSASSTNADPLFVGTVATTGSATVVPSAPSTTYTISCTALGVDTLYQQSVTVNLDTCPGSRLILSAEPAPAQCTAGYKTNLSLYSPSGTTFISCTPVTSMPAGPAFPILIPPNPTNSFLVTIPMVTVPANPTTFTTMCTAADGTVTPVSTSVARTCEAPSCSFTDASISGDPLKADLSWVSSGGVGAGITAGGGWTGTKAFSGSATDISFSEPETTYSLTVTNPDGAVYTCSTTLDSDCTDGDCDVVATVDLTASPDELGAGGGSTTLEWETTGIESDSCVGYSWPTLPSWNTAQDDNGSQTVFITTSTTFRIQCIDANDGGVVSDDVTVVVEGTPPPPPVVCTDPEVCPSVRTKPWYIER